MCKDAVKSVHTSFKRGLYETNASKRFVTFNKIFYCHLQRQGARYIPNVRVPRIGRRISKTQYAWVLKFKRGASIRRENFIFRNLMIPGVIINGSI